MRMTKNIKMLQIWTVMLLALATTAIFSSCGDDGYILSSDEVPLTNLPRVSLSTANNEEITRKITYADILVENAEGTTLFAGPVTVNGRGNTTWWENPKKSYEFFLDDKRPLLSMGEGVSWVLLANYNDATLIRNDVAMFMGREMGHLDYTPDSRFVDLILNGRYWGVYQMLEPVEVSENRVDVGNDGFLIEIDGKARYDDPIFYTTRLAGAPFNIKYPETMEGDENYAFIKDFVQKAEDALHSPDFLDEERGYRKYIDVDSFVEWYLVNEISKNIDAAFYTSCFFSLVRGGKLKMGPLWDFDSAFANNKSGGRINDPKHAYFKDKGWFARLFEDPAFVAKVKSRFNEYYSNRQMIYDRIDQDAMLLSSRMVWDNKVWGRLCDSSSSENSVLSEHAERIQLLKGWIEERMRNLKAEMDAL